jgi:hypothetical protein
VAGRLWEGQRKKESVEEVMRRLVSCKCLHHRREQGKGEDKFCGSLLEELWVECRNSWKLKFALM